MNIETDALFYCVALIVFNCCPLTSQKVEYPEIKMATSEFSERQPPPPADHVSNMAVSYNSKFWEEFLRAKCFMCEAESMLFSSLNLFPTVTQHLPNFEILKFRQNFIYLRISYSFI